MLGYTFYTIGWTYPIRNVYISSLIQQEQVYYIQNSIAKFNLTRTYDKNSNHIRIQYDNSIIANTAMSAFLYSIGSFVVSDTTISFNPNLYDNILGCIILHELGHAVGLGHNSNVGSIMNYSLYVDSEGYILNNNDECELSQDDNLGIEYLSKKKI
jgi:hypothetical protein